MRRSFVVMLLCSACSSAPSDPPGSRCGPLPITPGGMEASPGVHIEDVDDATARAWTPSRELRATATSRAVDDEVVVTVTLTNLASEPRDAIYLNGGVMFASSNPLALSVPLSPRPMPAGAPRGPEVYPAPRRAILPPGGTLQVSAAICPDAYEHTPGQRVDVAWSFELWSEPKPRGTIAVALP